MKSRFYKCSCSSHLLEIDTSFRSDGEDTYFSIWELGRSSDRMSLLERIRWCFHVIKTGKPWADSVCLNDKQLKEIIKQLKNEI